MKLFQATVVLTVLNLAINVNQVRGAVACYGIGDKRHCFSNDEPFNGLPLPQDPTDEIAPTFYVFRRGSNNSSPLAINDSSELNLNNNHELVVVIHGWMGDFPNTESWHMPLISNLLKIKPRAEVLFVEWSKGAALRFGANPYASSAANTRSIAAVIVDFLLDNGRFNARKSHCIGFSLGSHICGFAGKRLIRAGFPGGWGRITALDPAFPYFDSPNPATRVDSSDGLFVDVVHTSRLGLQRAIGHVDFYVSGGLYQPGCSSLSGRRRRRQSSRVLVAFAERFTVAIEDLFACSHLRAPLIFAESILAYPGSNLTESCSFSEFCPCTSEENYSSGVCGKCSSDEAQTIGYWSFRTPKFGRFFGELAHKAPFCVLKA